MATDGYANRLNGVEYNAVDERRFDSPLLMPGAGGGAFAAKSGRRVNGAGLVVSVGGSPEAWTCAAGAGVIFDTAYASQGAYRFEIPNSVSANLPARPGAGQSRIDLIVARVYDNAAIGSGPTEVKVERVNGTAGATPSAPTLPALSVELARLTVPASGGITVTVSPERTVAAGGILPVPTTAVMDKLKTDGIAYRDMVVGNAQTNALHRYDGTNWVPLHRDTTSGTFWGTAYNSSIHTMKTHRVTVQATTSSGSGDVNLVADLTTLFAGVDAIVPANAQTNAAIVLAAGTLGNIAFVRCMASNTGAPLLSYPLRVSAIITGWV